MRGQDLDWVTSARWSRALEHKLQAEGCSAAAVHLLLSRLVAGYAEADKAPLAAYLVDPRALQDWVSALQLRCDTLRAAALPHSGPNARFHFADQARLAMHTALHGVFALDCSLTAPLATYLLCSQLWHEALAIATSSRGSQPAADSQQQDGLQGAAAEDQSSPITSADEEEEDDYLDEWQHEPVHFAAAAAPSPSADEDDSAPSDEWHHEPVHYAAAATQRQLQQQPSQTLFVQLFGILLNPWAILAAGCLPLLASTGLLTGAQCDTDWTGAGVQQSAALECRAVLSNALWVCVPESTQPFLPNRRNCPQDSTTSLAT